MIYRPKPVDPAWLAQIEQIYGDYQLVPMTATGERGLVTQMRIEAESVPFLERIEFCQCSGIAEPLGALLETPSAPVLKLRWDDDKQLWTSDFG